MISHHPPFVIALAPLALMVGAASRSWRMALVPCAVALLVALAVLATVALRTSFLPWLNWGEATTLADWWAHVSAVSYRGYFLSATLAEDGQRAAYAAATLARQGGWLTVGLAALGLSWLWHQWRQLAVMCGGLAAFFVVFAVLYNARDSIVYLAPVVVLLGLCAGLGAAWLLRLASPRLATLLTIALLVSVSWQVWAGWPEVDAADDQSVRTWATQQLHGLPVDATVHVRSDDQMFALWYLQRIEGVRPHVIVIDDGLVATPWFCRQLARQHGLAPTCPA